jgi:hypothetical protein
MAAETIIQIRRGLAATWSSLNPILSAGEMGLETDTKKMKIGDGSTVWNTLAYRVGQVDNINFSGNTISSVDANGDITLDPNGTGDVRIADTADLYVGGDVYADNKKLATLEYVDAVKQGLDVKDSVRVATTGNVTLSGTQTIDGVSVVAGNRVLVKAQSTASENGIYVVAAGAWPRADDANADADVTAGLFTFVEEGTVNQDSGWVLTTNGAITLDTTGLAFTQFSGAGSVTAGAGLTKEGNTLDVGGTADRITVNADSVDIASTYAGQNTITTLGTVTTGTWNASAIPVANGGTGATDAETARTNLGVVIGTDVQAYDAELAALAGLTSAVDALPYFTGSGTASVTTLTEFGRSLVDDVDSSAARTTLGVVIGTDVQAYDAELAALAGLTSAVDALPYFTGSGTASVTTLTNKGRELLDDVDSSAMRTTLGVVIGTDVQAHSATLDAVSAGTYSGDDSIVTVGTVTAGTWNATTVGTIYGGTGLTSYTSGDIIYASAADTLSKLAKGTGYQFLKMNSAGTAPEWSSTLDGGTP